ncbi:hypothetical protein [Paenibacillus tundrae]
MFRSAQQLMLFSTAVVLFVTACLYGQQLIKTMTDALHNTTQFTVEMEGRMNTTLRTTEPKRYSGAEVLHTVRQMTGTSITVEVDGLAHIIDPLINRKKTIPVQLNGSYRPEFIRDEGGGLMRIQFWKEASVH